MSTHIPATELSAVNFQYTWKLRERKIHWDYKGFQHQISVLKPFSFIGVQLQISLLGYSIHLVMYMISQQRRVQSKFNETFETLKNPPQTILLLTQLRTYSPWYSSIRSAGINTEWQKRLLCRGYLVMRPSESAAHHWKRNILKMRELWKCCWND